MQDFEQLGAFYLGKPYDPLAAATLDEAILYDSKDLTTHAVILGMTGSGKTGLGVAILEEAAIDGIPAIVIDPKGDLGSLLLSFPSLAPSDFRPWIDDSEAVRRGVTPDVLARTTSESWRQGLASFGQDPARIARYHDAAEAVIYTPGSAAGVPLAILKSFAAPGPAVANDAELLRERVTSTCAGLLTLIGVDADPVKSREHLLISTLLERAWREGRDLDVAALIREVQTPPFSQVGVFDLESFFPAQERFGLAMAINALVASPAFAAWTQGEPIDIPRLLWTATGKPRLAVISIAHLSDSERMFFVTALLNEVIAWMRAQQGTPSLRALLYMDEVFGFLPPVANPPSKRPMLLLLKQARAFGLGVVLATQNPVDLDYKGLGNAGTWFLGRLQTERDKARVLDGLEGASVAASKFDRARLDTTLSSLKPRTFLMVNAHDDAPTLFQTRWTLSYLAGPLTRPQIQTLTAARSAAEPRPATTAETVLPYGARSATSAPMAAASPPAALAPNAPAPAAARPALPPDIVEYFLPLGAAGGGSRLEYRPTILGSVRAHFVDAKSGIDLWQALGVWAPLPDEMTMDPWEGARILEDKLPEFHRTPAPDAGFAALTRAASQPKTYAGWQRSLEEWFYRTRAATLWRCPARKQVSQPNEGEAEFRARIALAVREQRDLEVEALRKKYSAKVTTLADRLRSAEERVAREKSQSTAAKLSTGVSFATSVLGALFGGRKMASVGNVSRMGTAVRGIGRSQKEAQDVARAEESVEVLGERLTVLNAEIESEITRVRDAAAPAACEVVQVKVAPRKSDITAGTVALVWTPFRIAADGTAEAAS